MRDELSEQKVKLLVLQFKKLRLKHGFSYATLAEKTGLSDRAISMIEGEKRTPTILTCFKICKALGVSLEDILKDI